MECRQVASDVWLGVASCGEAAAGCVPERRWRIDRAAADRAVGAVLAASGFDVGRRVISRSHTRGSAAAVAAPVGYRIGVDLVEVDRVGPRHGQAVMTRREKDALTAYAAPTDALAWALKEAAAKALGDPLRCFPHGLIIEAGRRGVTVRDARAGGARFAAGWTTFGKLLCAWVSAPPR